MNVLATVAPPTRPIKDLWVDPEAEATKQRDITVMSRDEGESTSDQTLEIEQIDCCAMSPSESDCAEDEKPEKVRLRCCCVPQDHIEDVGSGLHQHLRT